MFRLKSNFADTGFTFKRSIQGEKEEDERQREKEKDGLRGWGESERVGPKHFAIVLKLSRGS